jgi:hypothetical protein
VGEALAHRAIEGSHSILDELVHDESGHPVGFQSDRPEAAVNQLSEQFVANQPEGWFEVGRLTEPQQVT